VNEPSSLGNPEPLKDLGFVSGQWPTTDLGQHQSESQQRSDATDLADALAAHNGGEESRFRQELEKACLATGATGAAIALVQGEQIVCRASAGPHAPDIGVCLDPRNGLSGSCIQTRQIQQCNDTETDPRVDPEACRQLGVRSIVVLPLVRGKELLGVFEILSSRPNAFGPRDLDSLKALSAGILQDSEATAKIPSKASASLSDIKEVIPENKSTTSKSELGIPRRQHPSGRNDIKTAILGGLVIASAILLGTLVGWRLGWQKATLGLRASSPRYQENIQSKSKRTDRTGYPGKGLQPSSAWTEECGQSAAPGPPGQPPSGGLTVCQAGRVIFRLPSAAPSPIRNVKASQRSPGLETVRTRR
jgi:hypothetical protein